MAESTKIEWCDHTASPWHGCSKVHAGCDHCYAESLSLRNQKSLGVWGDAGTRVKSKSFIASLEKWNRKGEREQRVQSVFPSLCDPFEDRPELVPWRNEMFEAIDRLPWVRLILLTKRPENIRRMWTLLREMQPVFPGMPGPLGQPQPCLVKAAPRLNVWLLTSVSNQETVDKQIPALLQCRNLSPVLGISAEPLLGPIDLTRINLGVHQTQGYGPRRIEWDALRGWEQQFNPDTPPGCDLHKVRCSSNGKYGAPGKLDWVIVGAESGPGARPMHPDWARSIRDQCQAAGVAFFFKQWGEWAPIVDHPTNVTADIWLTPDGRRLIPLDGTVEATAEPMANIGKKAAGRLLDGREWNELPGGACGKLTILKP